MTPPIDQEEEDEESRKFEAQAREDLEKDGCPPCYPPHLVVPLQNPPEEYKPIIDYWQSMRPSSDVLLCEQREDWQNFRAFQARIRRRHPIISTIIDEVRKRRQSHGLSGDVNLLMDHQQQSRQQNWLEYQWYHLRKHERLEKDRDELIEGEGSAHKNADIMDNVGSGHPAVVEEVHRQNLEYAERKLRWHEVLLSWIEQQRLAMDPEPPTRLQEDSDNRNALPVASDAILPGSTPRPPKLRQTKGKPLGPHHPQRVSKTKRLADAGTNFRLRTRPRRRVAPQGLDCGPGLLKTRSGRVSRPPVRWTYE